MTSAERDGDRQEAAEAGATAAHGGRAQPVVGEARKETADGDAPLQAGNVQPGADVRTRAEGQVPIGLTGDVEPVGIRELGRIAGIAPKGRS